MNQRLFGIAFVGVKAFENEAGAEVFGADFFVGGEFYGIGEVKEGVLRVVARDL